MAILFFANWVSGSIYSGKVWNMVADQIRVDQSRIIEVKEENEKMYEAEILRLQEDLDKLKAQKLAAQAETERLKGLVREKDGEILALKKEREAIVVAADPRDLVGELHRMGFGSARIRSR